MLHKNIPINPIGRKQKSYAEYLKESIAKGQTPEYLTKKVFYWEPGIRIKKRKNVRNQRDI